MDKFLPHNLFKKPQSVYHPSVFEKNLDQTHPLPDFNRAAFSWIAPEYLQHPKSVRWWVIAGLFFLVAIVIEALVANWTMLAATLAFGLVYAYLHYFHPPRHTKINLSELGVKLGHKSIPYEDIEAFWIIYNPPHSKKLYLRLKDKLIPDLVIELEHQDPQAIRRYLEMHLVEITGMRESFTDLILRLLKL
jgi:hypothetical protein